MPVTYILYVLQTKILVPEKGMKLPFRYYINLKLINHHC